MVRVAVGLEFFGSGLGKLGRVSGLIQFFRSLGIPGAEILAPFVASTELVCGVLIAIGLATRPAAVMLCGVMTVAIVTAVVPEKHITASWHGMLGCSICRRSSSSCGSPGSSLLAPGARVSTPGSVLAAEQPRAGAGGRDVRACSRHAFH